MYTHNDGFEDVCHFDYDKGDFASVMMGDDGVRRVHFMYDPYCSIIFKRL